MVTFPSGKRNPTCFVPHLILVLGRVLLALVVLWSRFHQRRRRDQEDEEHELRHGCE